MAFDKEEYWKRRHNTVTTGKGKKKVEISRPLRGQGDKPAKKYVEFNPVSTKPVSKKALLKNTKRARKAQLNGV
jgi:hypothetical protein